MATTAYFAESASVKIPIPGEPYVTISHHPSANVVQVPGRTSVKVFRMGRDYRSLTVHAATERANRGDAEMYLWTLLKNLAETGLGELKVRYNSPRLVYCDCVFVSGSGSIVTRESSARVEVNLEFTQGTPEDETNPDASYSSPDDYGTFDDTSSAANYKLVPEDVQPNEDNDDIALGDWAEVVPAVQKQVLYASIPRAWGVRMKDTHWGRAMRFTVTAHVHKVNRDTLDDYLRDLQQQVRDRQFTLDGNGNEFTQCFVESINFADDAAIFSNQFTVTLVQEVA